MFPSVLFTLSVILTLAGFLSRYGWLFDLAAQFHLQYFWIQAACLFLFFRAKQMKLVSVCAVFLCINLSFIIPFYFPAEKIKSKENMPAVKILIINVNSYNKNVKSTIRYIREMNPDILALEEINERWLFELHELLKEYPYKKEKPRHDNFGSGLYSKIPFDDVSVVVFGEIPIPSILAKLKINGTPTTLLFTHAVPPVSLKYYRWRNAQLKKIAQYRPLFEDSLIVLGDLNTTSWTHAFKQFTKDTGLIDTRKGFGLQTTWPMFLPKTGITIDHCLISRNLTVVKRKTGPFIGSDHYPVYLEIK